MKVLVTCASRHGSTAEIADELGRELAARGLEVDVKPADEVDGIAAYDAVVLGSAIYMGKWLPTARALADVYADELAQRPTWLFSSGPLGDPPQPAPPDFQVLDRQVDARGHRVFAGRLARADLSLAERGVARMVRASYGDFRDWSEVGEFADEIARGVGVGASV